MFILGKHPNLYAHILHVHVQHQQKNDVRNTFDVFVVQLFISIDVRRDGAPSIDAEKLPCQLFLLGFNPSFWCLRAWSSKLITELETETNFHFLSVRHSLMLQCYMYVYTSNRYTSGNHKEKSRTVFGLTYSAIVCERYVRYIESDRMRGVRAIMAVYSCAHGAQLNFDDFTPYI